MPSWEDSGSMNCSRAQKFVDSTSCSQRAIVHTKRLCAEGCVGRTSTKMAVSNHFAVLMLGISFLATTAAADQSLATRPGRKEGVVMKRELVTEEQIALARRGKPESRADFGEPEEEEAECPTSGPVRFGNVTWSGVRKQTMEGTIFRSP